MASARSARRIGAWSTVAWVMLIGTAIAVPATFAVGGGATFTSTVVMLLVISGVSNVVGLVLVYTAFGAGKVAVIAPVVSTEGAMGAVIAIVLGEQVALPVIAILGLIAAGVILAAAEGRSTAAVSVEPGGLAVPVEGDRQSLRAVGLALAAAFLFGINLYASARIGAGLAALLVILPVRILVAVGLAI